MYRSYLQPRAQLVNPPSGADPPILKLTMYGDVQPMLVWCGVVWARTQFDNAQWHDIDFLETDCEILQLLEIPPRCKNHTATNYDDHI